VKDKLQAFLAAAATLTVLWGLLVWDPCRQLRDIFASAGPAKEDARVSLLVTDSVTQEVSNGQQPLKSLHLLERSWCNIQEDKRYIITGNSQTFTVLLAPSETYSIEPERTYPDILLSRLSSVGAEIHGYRLSAPNISYMEVLWYLHYLILNRCLIPGELVVQLNFETFRKTGVREGMLELLGDRKFASAIDQEARSDVAYAGTFQKALDTYTSRLTKVEGNGEGPASSSKTGLTEARGTGNLLETKFRAILDRLPLFKSRGDLKGELLDFLYLSRVNLLGITPTTKRSLSGATTTMNISSLDRIGELCRRNGIRLVFFNAPQNPDTPLYRTPADHQQYQEIVSQLVERYATGYFDFENSIPAPMWGVWIDGPDPIHFGHAGHSRLAELMLKQGVISLGN
jgi:hypothetical protein